MFVRLSVPELSHFRQWLIGQARGGFGGRGGFPCGTYIPGARRFLQGMRLLRCHGGPVPFVTDRRRSLAHPAFTPLDTTIGPRLVHLRMVRWRVGVGRPRPAGRLMSTNEMAHHGAVWSCSSRTSAKSAPRWSRVVPPEVHSGKQIRHVSFIETTLHIKSTTASRP
jgi:hypothetical protein